MILTGPFVTLIFYLWHMYKIYYFQIFSWVWFSISKLCMICCINTVAQVTKCWTFQLTFGMSTYELYKLSNYFAKQINLQEIFSTQTVLLYFQYIKFWKQRALQMFYHIHKIHELSIIYSFEFLQCFQLLNQRRCKELNFTVA